jgi:hypothetical protein
MTFTFAPSPELFATLYPFHLVFDRILAEVEDRGLKFAFVERNDLN